MNNSCLIIGAAMRGWLKKVVTSSLVKDGSILGWVSHQSSVPWATIRFMVQENIVAHHIL
jgi:hypothetical protein